MEEVLMVRGVSYERKDKGRIRVNFPFEPNGTNLYLTKRSEKELVLTKHSDNHYSIPIPVRARTSKSSKYNCIDLTKYLNGEGFLTVSYDSKTEEYKIRPSTMKELMGIGKKELIRCKNKRSEGYFKSNSFFLGRKNMKAWLKTNNYVLATVHLEDTKSYIEFQPMSDKEKNIFLKYSDQSQETYSYLLSNNHMINGDLYFPQSFVRQVGLDRIMAGKVWKTEGDTLVLEPVPVKCSLCGKTIYGYEGHGKICVKTENLKSLKVIGRLMQEASKMVDLEDNFQTVHDDIRNLKEILEEMR